LLEPFRPRVDFGRRLVPLTEKKVDEVGVKGAGTLGRVQPLRELPAGGQELLGERSAGGA
jgi:hypothetical protein